MTTHANSNRRYPLLALAVLGVFSAARAEDEVTVLSKPESNVGVGVGVLSGNDRDRSLFGQYNGLRKHDVNLLLDFDYIKRDDATGTWTTVYGRDLGLDTPELGAELNRQGDWKLRIDYNQIVKHDIRTINTGLAGAGTTAPVVNLIVPGAGNNLDLELKRKALGLSGEKWIAGNLQLELSFRNEDKDGARLWGKGFNCPSGAAPVPVCPALAAGVNQFALLMLPEPVNSRTQQVEAKISYSTDNLLLTGGYYGSFYSNSNGSMTPTVPGVLYNPLNVATAVPAGLRNILGLPMALPPDNQAHQLYIDGRYSFTKFTHANFKLGYTRATQDQSFAGSGLAGAPAGVSDLGGKMNTTLAQGRLTSRLTPKLSVVADLRYKDRKDDTPIYLYNIEGANTFTNGRADYRKTTGKVEGSYQLPQNYRASLGVEYEAIDRGTFTQTNEVAGLTALRQKTDELTYRAELRKLMSETLSGALAYTHARRDGSNWQRPNAGAATGVTEVSDAAIFNRTGIFPAQMMNRTRDAVRLMADWQATEDFSLQFMAQDGKDGYSAPTTKGLRDTKARLYSLDASYALTGNWRFTAFWSREEQTIHVDHSTGYMADLENTNDSVGIGVNGRVSASFQLGANLSYVNDRNRYGQTLDPLTAAANVALLASTGGLPDVVFRQTRINLFGVYSMQKNGAVRLDFIHQNAKLNDWTWANSTNGTPFVYSDGTTVSLDPNQTVNFLGVRYIYTFQ